MFILQMSRLQTDDKSPFVTLGRVLMVLLCLSTVWVTYETFTLTEDERISAATEAFFQAVEDEDEATVNVLLLEPFDFSGPAPIRAGDRTQMFEGLTRGSPSAPRPIRAKGSCASRGTKASSSSEPRSRSP
jgi:hypothetical protein